MQNETRALLRNALMEALASEKDQAVFELAAILNGFESQPKALPPAPAAAAATAPAPQEIILPEFPPLPAAPCARGSYFWADAIQNYYLPTLVNSGVDVFTTPQMYGWIEAVGFPLTTGDWEMKGTRYTWKANAGQGLQHLHEKGVIFRMGLFGKTYSLQAPQASLAPA